MPSRATLASLAVAGWLALAVAGCAAGGSSAVPASSSGGSGRLAVSASFYPLQYLATKVGGDRVAVTTLTKPGVEPHDLELTSRDVAGLRDAVRVVYLAGLQPAVDTAVAQQAIGTGFDVTDAASLEPAGATGAGEDSGKDLHFWLDPLRLAAVGTALADRLAELDPAHAAEYRSNAAALAGELSALDTAYLTGLASCTNRQLVTSHAAFGYLAQRYGFTQRAIAGVSPEQEPSAKALADVAAAVRTSKATTVYSETLVDPKYAQTVANATGARVAVLDPVEGLTPSSPGSDYPEVMRANLATLRAGQGCA
ncbi:MAG: metal ABC transporter substrate-binding protein [Dermatophilaceae bacterium]